MLERYTGSGATVVFSSHVMELVESLCDWVAVMAAGRIVAQGPLAEVRGQAPTLQDAFLTLVGARDRGPGQDLDWLGGANAPAARGAGQGGHGGHGGHGGGGADGGDGPAGASRS